MQPITEAESALLKASNIEVDFGAEVLNLDLTINTAYGVNGDISAGLLGGSRLGVQRPCGCCGD